MRRTTTIFRSGNSQAVRIPSDLRLPPGAGVEIRKTATGLAIDLIDESVEQFIDRIAGSVPNLERPPQPQTDPHPAWEKP